MSLDLKNICWTDGGEAIDDNILYFPHCPSQRGFFCGVAGASSLSAAREMCNNHFSAREMGLLLMAVLLSRRCIVRGVVAPREDALVVAGNAFDQRRRREKVVPAQWQ